ncbi:hypothetical protein PG984_005321 [Apiospora sp. TS-2023a]
MSATAELIRLQRATCFGSYAATDEIYQGLKQYPKNKITTNYVEGHSGSGKSTQLFWYIFVKARWTELPGARAILIVRTEDERRLMKKVLLRGDGVLADLGERVKIWSRQKFLKPGKGCAERLRSPGGFIVFCDVEMLSDSMDEVFWGRLIETALAVKQDTTENCWMGLFLCASHRSDRTISTIREKLDPNLKVIDYESPHHSSLPDDEDDVIEWEQVQTKDWAFRVDWDFLENGNESRVLILGGRHSRLQDLKIAVKKRYVYEIECRGAMSEHGDKLLDSRGDSARVLWVGEDVDWAITLPKVECVFLDDCRETVQLDHATGLPVRVIRKLTKTELLRKQSWLRRAVWWARDYQRREGVTEDTPFPTTKVISVFAQEDMEQRPDDYAKFEPAWNENIMLTVLANYCAWPGLDPHQMPCRKPPTMALWSNTRQLLWIAGVLTEDNKPTELGIVVNQLASQYHWGWAEAYIVARVRLGREWKGLDVDEINQEEYILVLMAAIIGVEAEYKEPLVTLQGKPEDWLYPWDDSCAGGATGLSDRGSLWVQAGVCRKKQNHRGKFEHDHIKVNHRSYKQIDRHLDFISITLSGVLKAESAYEIDPNRTLDRHQLGYVDTVLAKAFAGQMVFIKGHGQDLGLASLDCVHVASGAPVRVPVDDDILYVGGALEGVKGMYMFSTRPLEPDGTRLRATGLTRMDRYILEEVAEEMSQTWPDVVKRPLWPMTHYKYGGDGGSSA